MNESGAGGGPWKALFAFTTRADVPLLVLSIVISCATSVVTPAIALAIGRVFDLFTDYALGVKSKEDFNSEGQRWVSVLLVIAAASWALHFALFTTWLSFGERQARTARDRLFHGMLQKDAAWFDTRPNGVGALLPRVQTQIRELQLSTSQPLGIVITLLAETVLSLLQAFLFSWNLTLVTIAGIPIFMAVILWAGRNMQTLIDEQERRLTEAQKHAFGAFASIDTVKCFNGQGVEATKYNAKVAESAAWYYRVVNANAIQMGLVSCLSILMFVQGFYYGGVLIRNGDLDTCDVITTFMSAVSAFTALSGVLPQMLVLEKGRSSGAALKSILDEKTGESQSVERSQGGMRPKVCHGDIELKNVWFRYPQRPDVASLRDVSLYIPGGEMTFIIGKSGSGKSTISQLLMRFYRPAQGTITLDSHAIERFDLSWLRSKITLVEQTSTLFNDSLFNNIALGRGNRDASKDEVQDAVQFALLQLTIADLPCGLDTSIGAKGGSLSGGQRQRVALARARLRDTPILILDESTSALDAVSRGLMMDAIRAWRKGKTTIVITHDIGQILPDDYVFVLENGAVAQDGYRKLMEADESSAFQAFLPGKAKSQGSRPREMSAGSERWKPDVRDTFLRATPASKRSRFSIVPRSLQEGSPLPAFRGAAQSGMHSAFASPFVRLAATPPSRHSGLLPQIPRGPGKVPSGSPYLPEPAPQENKRWTQIMHGTLDRYGRAAVAARERGVGVLRKPVVVHNSELDRRADESTGKVWFQMELGSDDAVEKTRPLKDIMRTLWPSIGLKQRVCLILGFFFATVHAIGSPVFGFVLAKLVATYAIPGGDAGLSLRYSMIILALAFIDGSASYLFKMLLEYVSQCWVNAMRAKAMTRILDQPREFFDREENAASRLIEGLDRYAEEMRNLLGRFLGMIWIATVTIGVSVVWALSAQWKMTLITLAAAPYIWLVTKAFAAVSARWEGRSNEAAEESGDTFSETLLNVKTVRALTIEKHFSKRYSEGVKKILSIGYKRSIIAGLFYGLSDSAGEFAIALMFFAGTMVVNRGEAAVEDAVKVFTLIVFCVANVSAVLEYIPQMGSSVDTASRLLRLTELPRDSHEHKGEISISEVGDIVLDDVEFAYPSRPSQTILKHISIRIEPGTCTAIVGGSGSGKSTIANLLLKLYSTTAASPKLSKGTISASNRPYQRISTSSLRALIVPVLQTPALFPATVAENIAYGLSPDSPLASKVNIIHAAHLAELHSFITSLPQGYATPLGEGGQTLSGGQAQRLAIARALVRRPQVLILDEATSALDVEAARAIRGTLIRLRREQPYLTLIVITHHVEMMELSDEVVVLEEGVVRERGPLEDLREKSGGALARLLSGGLWEGG